MSELNQDPLVTIAMWMQAIPPDMLFDMGNVPECLKLIQSGQMGAAMPQQLSGILGELIMLVNAPEAFQENLQNLEFINN